MVESKQERQLDLREVRQRAGWSQHKLALIAHVGVGSVRLFEANPDAVADPRKRASLQRVYVDLASLLD